MSKSPDAFRTISEVAEWLGIPAHVLRFWESKFSQIKPVKRAGGRRYYRPADMLLLGGIKHLLHDEGQTIKQVQALLRDHGPAYVSERSASLEATADPMPVVEIEDTFADFVAPRPSVPDQMHMDLDAPHEPNPPNSPVEESFEATADLIEFESQSPTSLPATDPIPAEPDPIPAEPNPVPAEPNPVPAETFDALNETDVTTTPPPAAAPLIVEIEDIADDSLNVVHAGVLAQLANITSLDAASQEQALICAGQLKTFIADQNNQPAN
ncbi:MerR family transcriptional regulator [Parasedimentitalea maritima]|uniref:MerR family transcriptional regulator n=1 Tax=Parasedimentitalea maritima TaxID=2578117 RepID=A0ABY2UUX6_9RHOB|nr:MerR family transcriptional regulator [Zongyanglinia marina]TLP64497.1 MerR family transcriptional regulator [Zongyanglinia marina]